jgi:hypothetical protein
VVLPEDDRSISDETDLFRRIHPQLDIQWDANESCWAVKSRAFQNTGGSTCGKMSVALADTAAADGRDPDDVLRRAGTPDWFLVALTAGDARAECQGVERAPTDQEPAHGNVVGRKTKGRKRALARAARWVIEPSARGAGHLNA